MNNQELNEYIKHYLKEDKTKSAIMLNAPWGTGKSYYIINTLRPYLESEENGAYKCIVVSLYGLSNLTDISKSIYIEARAKVLDKKSEKISAGKLVAKTLIKGVTSFFGIDLSMSENDLINLYQSIDLSGKFIILEDIERSHIDILELLGYVNSLVEQDGIKVMLVANEAEIIKRIAVDYKTIEEEEKSEIYHNIGLDNRPFTEKTKEYLKAKEKTVSDTIEYRCDYKAAIKTIIQSFNCNKLSLFLEEQHINELSNILNGKNLRSFIFACQKVVDIYNTITEELGVEFLKALFFGMVQFVINMKSGKEKQKWEGDPNLSLTLTSGRYPLFRCCYEYIYLHKIDSNMIISNANAYRDLLLYDSNYYKGTDLDLQVIEYFYNYYSTDIIKALQRIEKRLSNPEDISFYEYDKLAVSIIKLSRLIKYDNSNIKEKMILNLEGRGDKINGYFLIHRDIELNDEEERKEYELFKERLLESLRKNDDGFMGFEYTPETIKTLYDNVLDKPFDSENPFALKLDINRMTSLVKQCSPAQIENLRAVFRAVYRPANIGAFLTCDRNSIEQLLNNLKVLFEDESLDIIQNLQIKWFIANLEEILVKL